MQVTEKIQSPFSYKVKLPDTVNLTPVKEQVEIVNGVANEYGYPKVEFDDALRSVSIEYIAKERRGVDYFEGLARLFKNGAMEKALYRLVCLCNVLVSKPNITTLNGRCLPCKPVEHISSFTKSERDTDRHLFDENINLFLKNAEDILGDSRMFLTPVYCGKSCFFDGIPTLGVFVEFWQRCQELSVVEDDMPICFMSGNPMTGSHCCVAVSPDGKTMKAKLHIMFIDLLKLFGGINDRYKSVREVCQSYTLKEVVYHLKGKVL